MFGFPLSDSENYKTDCVSFFTFTTPKVENQIKSSTTVIMLALILGIFEGFSFLGLDFQFVYLHLLLVQCDCFCCNTQNLLWLKSRALNMNINIIIMFTS